MCVWDKVREHRLRSCVGLTRGEETRVQAKCHFFLSEVVHIVYNFTKCKVHEDQVQCPCNFFVVKDSHWTFPNRVPFAYGPPWNLEPLNYDLVSRNEWHFYVRDLGFRQKQCLNKDFLESCIHHPWNGWLWSTKCANSQYKLQASNGRLILYKARKCYSITFL